MLAPIVLFVFNRPDHARHVLNALSQNLLAKESHLIIYSDGPRGTQDEKKVISVRNVVSNVTGFLSVQVFERDRNYGLSANIIDGVTSVVNKFGRVIVLEDDLVTSPYFLTYMNSALDFYFKNDRVISIHGYVYPTKEKLPEAFFLKGADCWGWATWKRGWVFFNSDGKALLKELESKRLVKEFDFNGAYSFSKMLKDLIKGKNNSWAVRWHASAFLADKMTLYPGRSLVRNIGNDNTGTHCGSSSAWDVNLSQMPVDPAGIDVVSSELAYYAFERHFRIVTSFKSRLFDKIKLAFEKWKK
jgi:hypothetical protein